MKVQTFNLKPKPGMKVYLSLAPNHSGAAQRVRLWDQNRFLRWLIKVIMERGSGSLPEDQPTQRRKR